MDSHSSRPLSATAYDTPTIPWLIIVVCLLFSFVDMLLLSNALERLFDYDQITASLLAFLIALVGNATAFLWGRSQGLHHEKKKWAFYEPWIWLAFGLIFIAIRVIVIYMDIQDYPDDILSIISSEAVMAVLLSVVYAATGLALQLESKKIFDPRNYTEWRAARDRKRQEREYQKKQNRAAKKVAKKYAEAERMVLELENFDKYYLSIKKQYVIQRNALYDAERTMLSSVEKQLLEDNPRLDPQVVDDILQTVLADRPHVAKESLFIEDSKSSRKQPLEGIRKIPVNSKHKKIM